MNKTLLFLVTFIILSSCRDVFEKDIKNQKIEILAPKDSSISSSFNIMFWWDNNEYISSYRLQIASPNFSNPLLLVLDTLISDHKFYKTVSPGKYQFRIRGENNTGSTAYYYSTFEVDTNYDFTNQNFSVNLPLDYYSTNDSIISFSWDKFPFATAYTFTLYKPGMSSIIKNTVTNYVYDTLHANGVYSWDVFAINGNNTTLTNRSNTRILIFDTISPSPPTQISPVNNSLVNNSVNLIWSKTSSDVNTDSIYISTDASFLTIDYQYISSDTSLTFIGNSGNDYYWKVKSIDKAGNIGHLFSQIWKFRIN